MPIEQCWPEHKLKLTECDRGLQVEQDGASYIARSWKLCDDVVKLVDVALDCGFTCVIRHNHPRPNNRDERGVQYIGVSRSEEHTSELQSLRHLVCRLLLEKKK